MVIEFGREVFIPLGEVGADWVGDARTLSDRVWLARQSTRDAIDKRLRMAVINGDSPIAVARELEQYLSPSWAPQRSETGRLVRNQPKRIVTRTPLGAGGGSYPARRLARTEITRAFGMATIESARLNPFVKGVRWGLSSPYDPDRDSGICADNASGSSRGMPRGVYLVNEVPRYPAHPQERCYLAPYVDDDPAAVVAQLRRDFDLDPQPVRIVQAERPARARSLITALFRVAKALLTRDAA